MSHEYTSNTMYDEEKGINWIKGLGVLDFSCEEIEHFLRQEDKK